MIKQIRNFANKLSSPKDVNIDDLPRNVRRKLFKVANEAQSTYEKLCNDFGMLLFNSHSRLSSDELNKNKSEISRKWIFYCRLKKLNPSADDKVSKYCDLVISEYNKAFK